MANDRDDDLLGNGKDFYEQDETGSEEFQIPDDEHGDTLEDDLELTEDDVADFSSADESDLFFADESGDEQDDVFAEEGYGEDDTEHAEEGGDGDDVTHDDPDNEAEGQPEKAKLGWKAWTGLGLAVAMTTGGLAYFVLPGGESPRNAPRVAQVAPTPPPAPQETPRNVEAQPQEQSVIPPAQPQQNAGAPIQTDQFSMPNQGDITMGANAPVAPPQDRRNATDRKPEYLQNLEAQLAAFGNIAMLADDNRQKITQIEERFDDYREATDGELKDLDRRVTHLEGLLKRGGTLAENGSGNRPEQQSEAKKAPAKTERVNNEMANSERTERTDRSSTDDNSQFVYKVPKTPAEIKALQQKLKDYGYRPGKVDGILGEQTRWAIKRLQQEHGLPVNGWLSAETMMALQNPKHYSGTYPTETKRTAAKPTPKKKPASEPDPLRWYVRGVTPTKAVVYRQDGMSYVVSVGSEIPGMGQVTELDTDKIQVVTAKGAISRR